MKMSNQGAEIMLRADWLTTSTRSVENHVLSPIEILDLGIGIAFGATVLYLASLGE